MPLAAASERMIHLAVPRSSASSPNAAVHASLSTTSSLTAAPLVTLTRSLSTAAAGFTASLISLTELNMSSTIRLKPDTAVTSVHPPSDGTASWYSSTGNLTSSTTAAAAARSTISSIASASSARTI
jgi:hypothetical protein